MKRLTIRQNFSKWRFSLSPYYPTLSIIQNKIWEIPTAALRYFPYRLRKYFRKMLIIKIKFDFKSDHLNDSFFFCSKTSNTLSRYNKYLKRRHETLYYKYHVVQYVYTEIRMPAFVPYRHFIIKFDGIKFLRIVSFMKMKTILFWRDVCIIKRNWLDVSCRCCCCSWCFFSHKDENVFVSSYFITFSLSSSYMPAIFLFRFLH